MATTILHKMELNQKVEINSTTSVHRVPGGWVYLFSFKNENGTLALTSCFVPKNSEFKKGTGKYMIG